MRCQGSGCWKKIENSGHAYWLPLVLVQTRSLCSKQQTEYRILEKTSILLPPGLGTDIKEPFTSWNAAVLVPNTLLELGISRSAVGNLKSKLLAAILPSEPVQHKYRQHNLPTFESPMAPSTPVSSSGITVNAATGERHIPSSTRADGTKRREIRVRPGYRPPEDVEVYKNRAATAWKNRGVGGVPGTEGFNDDVSGPARAGTAPSKNAKKREAKKRAKAAEAENGPTGETNITASTATNVAAIPSQENWRANSMFPTASTDHVETVIDPDLEKEKKARNLRKKLRQARELREKKDKGEDLLPEQFEKIIKIQELIRQLDALGFDVDGEKKKDEMGDAV